MKSKIFLLIAILFFLCSCDSVIKTKPIVQVYSQNFNKAKMDSLFTRIDETRKGMGSISIFKNGKEIYQKAFGYADIVNHKQATTGTK